MIQSLQRGLTALRLVSEGVHTPAEVAERLEVHPTSALRLLATLEGQRFLVRDERGYQLGPALVQLGYQAARELDLTQVVHPRIQELSRETGETVLLAATSGNVVFYADKVESQHQVRMHAQVGLPVPLHCTGVGKAVLAHLPQLFEQMREQNEPLPRYTATTFTTYETLGQELARIRERGYAFDDREHEEDINCVAAPLFGAGGKIAGAISIAAPCYRFGKQDLIGAIPSLLEATTSASADLGVAS